MELCSRQKVKSPGSQELSFHSRCSRMMLLIDIQGCYNSSTMEGSLLLRSKVSNCEPKKVYSYTSPRVEEYERLANRYQQYVDQLAPKIDSICQKENYRTYLKEQKLHSIRHHLDAKKTQLESKLKEKSDPANSPNGKLHSELQELLKLEDNYRHKRDALQQNVDNKRAEMRRLTAQVQQQREQIKNQLKESFISQSQLQLPRLQKHDATFLTRNSSASFLSKSRASVLSRLNETNQEHMAQKLTNQEEKLILLKLLCVYAKAGIEQGQPHQYLGPDSVQYLEREIEIRSKLLAEVQGLMHKR